LKAFWFAFAEVLFLEVEESGKTCLIVVGILHLMISSLPCLPGVIILFASLPNFLISSIVLLGF
jgi:hypothetical protein